MCQIKSANVGHSVGPGDHRSMRPTDCRLHQGLFRSLRYEYKKRTSEIQRTLCENNKSYKNKSKKRVLPRYFIFTLKTSFSKHCIYSFSRCIHIKRPTTEEHYKSQLFLHCAMPSVNQTRLAHAILGIYCTNMRMI